METGYLAKDICSNNKSSALFNADTNNFDWKEYEKFKAIMHRRRSEGSSIIRGVYTKLKIKRLR